MRETRDLMNLNSGDEMAFFFLEGAALEQRLAILERMSCALSIQPGSCVEEMDESDWDIFSLSHSLRIRTSYSSIFWGLERSGPTGGGMFLFGEKMRIEWYEGVWLVEEEHMI